MLIISSVEKKDTYADLDRSKKHAKAMRKLSYGSDKSDLSLFESYQYSKQSSSSPLNV